MSEIIEKFLDVDTQEALEAQISAGDVTDEHIAFIDSPRKIWARGRYYNGSDIVPFANDLTGRIEATPEEFTFRPSAGDKSIRDESAIIKRIKGNTLVWNQLAYNGDFKLGTAGWAVSTTGNTLSVENGNLVVTTAVETSSGNIVQSRPIKKGVYAICAKWRVISEGYEAVMASGFFSSPTIFFPRVTVKHNEWIAQNMIITVAQDYSVFAVGPYFYAAAIGSIKLPAGAKIEYEYVNVVNLTQMFGDGNEPITVEEFKALFPKDYYDYNAGELVSMTSDGLFANGFNQFNGEYAEVLPNNIYYLGGTYTTIGFAEEIGGTLENITIPTDKLYTPTKKGYIYATGTNICINLSHTGVRNGEYEPYWDATKDLSIIQKYFPNGMRSAGSIYDEISFDETTQKWVAIQRVGSVDLGSLAWSEYISGVYWATVVGIKKVYLGSMANIVLASKLNPVSLYELLNDPKPDNSISVHNTISRLYAKATSYADAASFKTAMSGVMLYYELAEPIITPIEEPIDLSYKVGDFGIEKMLPDSLSAPFKADIIYQFNATDRVRENSMNISKLSKKHNLLESEVDALESKVDTEIENINTELDTINDKALTTDAQTLTEEQQLQVAQNISTDNVPSSIVRRREDGSITASIIHDGTYNYAMPLSSEDVKNNADYTLLTTKTSPTPDDIMLWDETGVLKSSGVHIASSVAEVQEASPDALPTSEQMMSVISDAIPTQIAEVMEVVPTSDVTVVMYPNRLYEASYATTITALRLVLDATGANMSGDNTWKVRFTAGGSNMLFTILDNATSSEANIYWLNGTPPTFDVWGFHEITFKRAGQQTWLGEWKRFNL